MTALDPEDSPGRAQDLQVAKFHPGEIVLVYAKKFKSSCLNIDWEIYKEARNDVQQLIKYKKKKYFEEKLAENIAKPKNFGRH